VRMRILRYVLLAASLVGAAMLIYLIATPHAPTNEKVVAIGIVVLLILNSVYILFSTPGTKPSRLMRLVGLWLDAKERELKNRAGNPPS